MFFASASKCRWTIVPQPLYHKIHKSPNLFCLSLYAKRSLTQKQIPRLTNATPIPPRHRPSTSHQPNHTGNLQPSKRSPNKKTNKPGHHHPVIIIHTASRYCLLRREAEEGKEAALPPPLFLLPRSAPGPVPPDFSLLTRCPPRRTRPLRRLLQRWCCLRRRPPTARSPRSASCGIFFSFHFMYYSSKSITWQSKPVISYKIKN